MSRSWRLLSSSSSSGSPSLAARPIHSSPKPPYKTHRRQLNQLERAAAIGLAALQAQQQGSPLAADDAPATAAASSSAAGVVSSLPFGLPPAVAQLQLQKPKKKVGALQKVPVISPPDELAASALKRAVKMQPAAGLKNEADKERSRAAKQLDTHMKELSVPLSRYLKSFPPLSALHPFEAALLDLTVGAATYASVLGKADALRKAIQEVRAFSRSCCSRCLSIMCAAALRADVLSTGTNSVLGEAHALCKSIQEVCELAPNYLQPLRYASGLKHSRCWPCSFTVCHTFPLLVALLLLPQVGKGFANRAANAANKRAAAAVAEEGSAALAAVFDKGAKAVEDLKKVGRPIAAAVLPCQQHQHQQHWLLCFCGLLPKVEHQQLLQ
jgi:hypothetical protein